MNFWTVAHDHPFLCIWGLMIVAGCVTDIVRALAGRTHDDDN